MGKAIKHFLVYLSAVLFAVLVMIGLFLRMQHIDSSAYRSQRALIEHLYQMKLPDHAFVVRCEVSETEVFFWEYTALDTLEEGVVYPHDLWDFSEDQLDELGFALKEMHMELIINQADWEAMRYAEGSDPLVYELTNATIPIIVYEAAYSGRPTIVYEASYWSFADYRKTLSDGQTYLLSAQRGQHLTVSELDWNKRKLRIYVKFTDQDTELLGCPPIPYTEQEID